MTTFETIDKLRKSAARLSAQGWVLKSLEATLPEGRSKDAVEVSRLGVENAVKVLEEEALALERYAALEEGA